MTNYPTTVVDITGKSAAEVKTALDAVCISGIYLVCCITIGSNVFAICQMPTSA